MELGQDLATKTYDELFVMDYIYNGKISHLLCYCGEAIKTVCPECHVDDFTHVEGCSKTKLIEDI